MSDLIQTTAEAEGGHCVTGSWGDFAQLPRVGVTHCKDRRWKEQITTEEMRFGQGGWPNGSTAKCCTPCFFLVVFNFQNALGAC